MEKLQGPIHPCVLEEQLNIGCLDEENVDLQLNYGMQYVNPESLRFEDYNNTSSTTGGQAPNISVSPHTLPNLEDKMPFLQMLQSFDYPPVFQEPNFQLLLKLQHQQKKQVPNYLASVNSTELESCVTNEIVELDMHYSPVKSEIREQQQQQQYVQVGQIENTRSDTKSKRCLLDSTTTKAAQGRSRQQQQQAQMSNNNNKTSVAVGKERRKRKRTRPVKNKEEVETQRMAHIEVERNRRRQMNEHLTTLKALMPSSYVQRGDQASIIGGAIDFVKELEQLLQSLQAQKRMKNQTEDQICDASATTCSSTTTTSTSNMINNLFMPSPPPPVQLLSNNNNNNYNSQLEDGNSAGGGAEVGGGRCGDEFMAENRSEIADIEAVVIHNHVNLKVHCKRRQGQLLKAIVAFEDVRLSVLHLNITSLHGLVYYSFNLKIEDDCNLRSADEIVGAVHQIFSLINS